MSPIDPSKLSLDYLLNNKVITILSWDYVLENGAEFDCEEICWDYTWGDFKCNPDGSYYSGLLYEFYSNGTLAYYSFHKNGLRDGVDVCYYLSGELQSYRVYDKGRLAGKSYEWYENGMIKEYIDCDHNKRILFDRQGKIIK